MEKQMMTRVFYLMNIDSFLNKNKVMKSTLNLIITREEYKVRNLNCKYL